MKILKLYTITAISASLLLFTSCAHEDSPRESQLDYTQPQKTALDNWIEVNYLKPYNIFTV
jgi:hypothetical protein